MEDERLARARKVAEEAYIADGAHTQGRREVMQALATVFNDGYIRRLLALYDQDVLDTFKEV